MEVDVRGVAFWAGAILTLAAADPAFARPVTAQDNLGDAVTQPLRDLSIVRRRIPDTLQRAMESPYAAPAPTTCAQISTEIAALDEALGPDFDSATGVRRTNMIQGLAVDGVRSVVDLPFRGIVRVITGARRRDDRLQSAIVAGVSRRGFLKGMSRAMACDGPGAAALNLAVAEPVIEPMIPPSGDPFEADTGQAVETVAQVEDEGP